VGVNDYVKIYQRRELNILVERIQPGELDIKYKVLIKGRGI
jgi:hypothetical protein